LRCARAFSLAEGARVNRQRAFRTSYIEVFTMKRMCSILLTLLVAAGVATLASAADYEADNTGRNVRDRDGDTLTSGDQSETEADRELTQKIRQSVMEDDSLSMTAHNVKIITVNGMVTLRGPVKNAQERQAIAAKAVEIAGAKNVNNQLEVAR
jgi:adenylylsulfate kinase-like enzyme